MHSKTIWNNSPSCKNYKQQTAIKDFFVKSQFFKWEFFWVGVWEGVSNQEIFGEKGFGTTLFL